MGLSGDQAKAAFDYITYCKKRGMSDEDILNHYKTILDEPDNQTAIDERKFSKQMDLKYKDICSAVDRNKKLGMNQPHVKEYLLNLADGLGVFK